MEILSGKQKRYLRAQGNQLPAVFSIGKNGLSKVWLGEVLDALRVRELIKISLQQNSSSDIEDAITFIQKNSQITVAQKIGHTLLLYLPATNPDYQKISLEVNELAH
ncbi:YhbY family RNA-binding protein [Oenococcus kitaharae]|uniref:YhbY family RNA-binding protein n=1 Tax=Oenococcus TaxID=46254 RepID=UPI0021E6D969|nr:YhbY family RNA-binding protein [Oenococcus kitaharae]MCV3295707.1 YhbY family RNA-binding protein [Oenococcus kitaharae]